MVRERLEAAKLTEGAHYIRNLHHVLPTSLNDH